MIFHSKEGDPTHALQKRDLSEARRVTEIEVDYFQNIRLQEKLFNMFKDIYNEIRLKNKKKPEQRAILDYCLDCWAFFLDRYTDAIELIPKKSSHEANIEKDHIMQAFHNEIKVEIDHLKDMTTDKLRLPPSRLMQVGHIFMKQELKRGNKFKDAGNKKKFKVALSLYRKAGECGDPFALYYTAAAQLNVSFHSKNTMFDKGRVEQTAIKQEFYKIIPLFHNKIRQCQTHITMLLLANRHHDQIITGNMLYFQEQKQHEMEMYTQFISSMQDVIGKEITKKYLTMQTGEKMELKLYFKLYAGNFALKILELQKVITADLIVCFLAMIHISHMKPKSRRELNH